MLCRAAILLMELKALLASTSRVASVSSSRNASRTEWTAASQPESWPAQSWMEPAASSTSPLTTTRTASGSSQFLTCICVRAFACVSSRGVN